MSATFEPVFDRLRRLMLDHSQGLAVTRDEPGDLLVRTPDFEAKTGTAGWFGTVTIKRSYVAYHLTALYDHMALAETLGPPLSRRRQGKTCFNFKTLDDETLEALCELTASVREAIAMTSALRNLAQNG